MHQKEKLFQMFLDFQKVENVTVLDSMLFKFKGASIDELLANLAKFSFSSGDNFHSLYFFYRALFENYFIKYLGFFNKSLFDYTKFDLVTQALVVFKSDFSVICSILLVIFFCINKLRNHNNISKKTYIFSVFFIMSVLFAKESVSLVLVRDKTSFMTENSAVFDAGKVSSGPEVFLKISEDDLFFKVLTSNLEPFWVRKSDALILR